MDWSEYQVAVTMIKEGMIEEAFTIIKAIRDRYDGYKRCHGVRQKQVIIISDQCPVIP